MFPWWLSPANHCHSNLDLDWSEEKGAEPGVCLGKQFLHMTTQASKEEFTVSFGYEPGKFLSFNVAEKG